MRHRVEETERPVGDLYITRRQDIEEVPLMLRAEGFELLWDPCASGAAPWTVGEILAQAWGIPRLALTDLYPRREGIRQMDYLKTPRPRVEGPILQASNPPYFLFTEWIQHWSQTALPGDAALWCLAYDTLPVRGDRAQGECCAILQPDHRLAFQLTYEDAVATGRDTKKVKKNGKTIHVPRPVVDGRVELEATGKSHGWIVWQKREEGTPPRRREHILLGEEPFILSGARRR